MAPSQLKRYILARRDPEFLEQHFPDSEFPGFGRKLIDGVIFALVSLRTWLMLVLTVLATFLCSPGLLNLRWGTDMSIIAIGTVFPLVFAIQAAYAARGLALSELGRIKGKIMYLYFSMKALDRKYGTGLAARISELASELGIALIKSLHRNEPAYECYDLLAVLIDEITEGAADKLPHPLFSSISANMGQLVESVGQVRLVRDYETPKGLRSFANFLICVTPIFLAPFWSSFCSDASGGEVFAVAGDGTMTPVEIDDDEYEGVKHPFGCVAGYFIAVLYVIITFSLLRVQEALEDPFDGMGEDDIKWQVFARHLEDVETYGADGEAKRAELKKELEHDSYQKGATAKWD